MTPRTIAIGDIHGCSQALKTLLAAVKPRPEDRIVTLGDYVNRGPDSRGVLEQLIALEQQCALVALLGNHDQTMLDASEIVLASDPAARLRDRGDSSLVVDWLRMGGDATLASYGADQQRLTVADFARIPPSHYQFLARCHDYYETPTHIFVHAQYDPVAPMNEQAPYDLRWLSLKMSIPGAHVSGKTVVTGHSSQKNGEILDLGHIICIDTYCYGGGWLTAMDVASGEAWQANRLGELRSGTRG